MAVSFIGFLSSSCNQLDRSLPSMACAKPSMGRKDPSPCFHRTFGTTPDRLLRLGTVGQNRAAVIEHIFRAPRKAASVLRRISVDDGVLPDNLPRQSHPPQLSRTVCFKQPRRDFTGLGILHVDVYVTMRIDQFHFRDHAIDADLLVGVKLRG